MIPKDPTDERLRERTSASFLASLIVHALVALLFFSVVTSSSEQSSPETSEGAPLVIVSHVRLSKPTKSVPQVVHPPQTHAPKIGKPLARPVLAGHKPVFGRHELAKQNPSAPPNPTPVPAAPASPNPQPTQVAIATPAPVEYPAVPVSIPSAAPVIAQRAVTPEPSAAPPTNAPTSKPSPAPAAPASAQPLKATPQPTAAPTLAPATAAKQLVQATPAPQKTAEGIPSPRPTGVPSTSPQRGVSPTTGPKALASPGPAPQAPVRSKPAPAKPIALPPPTPTPAPRPTPRPRPTKTVSPKKQQAYADLNARLRGLLPNGPVTPTTKRYAPGASAVGPVGDPTAPPEVLAVTKFTYFTPPHKHLFGNAQNDRFMMWVKSIRRAGAVTLCTGWLVRFPAQQASFGQINMQNGRVTTDTGPRAENNIQPSIEENATIDCPAGQLVPYKSGASPAPSPTP